MSYLPVTLNHFRAIKAWAGHCAAEAFVDASAFTLKVTVGERYCVLKPRFLMTYEGKMAYTTDLVDHVTGFIGWLPYDVLGWDFSQNKLLAKDFFQKSGLLSPKAYSVQDTVEDDYIVKSFAGSFGYEVTGPFRKGTHWGLVPGSAKNDAPEFFAEQFIAGKNLKVWYWGATAVYAQLHAYPAVTGDGESSVQQLIAQLQSKSGNLSSVSDQEATKAVLAFQRVSPADVIPEGQHVWVDFRYGRRYVSMSLQTQTDSDLGDIDPAIRRQIDLAGAKLSQEALLRFKVPILFSVDGVLDAEGKVWWLEVNSNPMVPPETYPLIFQSLFGSAKKDPA